MKTEFRKYDHLVRLGHRSVEGITEGLVHVFPKIDGTNASVWFDGESIQCASRRRVLAPGDDNAGFCSWVLSGDLGDDDGNGADQSCLLRGLCMSNPNWIVYGEWMVPHSLKTYRADVWRKFWIFDVYDRERRTYVDYQTYKTELETYELDYIEPLCTFRDGSEEQLMAQTETNTYLIEEGKGLGEGVVLKNYAWRRPGAPWAKVVRNVFKELSGRTFGVPSKKGEKQVEAEIAQEFVTEHLVEKTRAKVCLNVANGTGMMGCSPEWQRALEAEHRGKVIPQLLGRVWNDLIEEEMWAILKKHKGATIDFKKLQNQVTLRVKCLAEGLF